MSHTDASDPSIQSIRDSIAAYLRRSQSGLRLRQTRVGPVNFDRQVWRELGDLGVHAVLVPEDRGGLGLDIAHALAIAEELGAWLTPEPFVGGSMAMATLLNQVPAGALAERLQADLLHGSLVAGIAWQENLGELEPTAGASSVVWQGDAGRLNGLKRFCVPGQGSDGWAVLAASGGEPLLLWVPATAGGVTLMPLARVDGSSMADVTFEQVPVQRSDVLAQGETALRAVAHALETARLGQAAELLGGARRALELTLEHLRTRQQFGVPIGSFQALKHRAADAYIAVELAQATLGDAAAECLGTPSQLAHEARRAKARALHTATLVGRFAIQCHGAMGFTDECDAGHYFKQAMAAAGWLGGMVALRRLAAEDVQDRGVNKPAWHEASFPRDADWDAMPESEFRAMVRAFAERHCPPTLRHLPRTVSWKEYKPWFMALSAQGWVAPAWPKAHGGMALSPARLIAYYEELEDHGVPRAAEFGITMIGPLLIRHGTPEQQQTILPAILRGEYVWSQGYSEPGAGSDLASLTTAARLEGDRFIVNGQKIWNGHANSATHMFMLVRTARRERRQDGISFLLVDLNTPGITVRGIRDIAGEEKLCEVFFDNVAVPQGNLVGTVDQGWTLAKNLLEFERLHIGSPKQARSALARLRAVGEALGLLDDPAFAPKFAECAQDVRDASALYRSFADIFKSGRPLPPNVGMLKIVATETYQKVCTAMVDAAAECGGLIAGHAETDGVDSATMLLTSLPSSIYGGSNEIQRNILAKVALHLPD